MTQLFIYLRSFLLTVGMVLATIPLSSHAEVPRPDIPQAKARFSDTQGCVEPTADMRKNHMEYILHQRDDTMRQGIRTSRHSLQECINCHVPSPDSGEVVRITDKQHFCNSCHSYAAVKIDCFSCHRDTPMPKTGSAMHRLGGGKGHHFTPSDDALNAETLQLAVEEQPQ